MKEGSIRYSVSASRFSDTKEHFVQLDGLRGSAALIVVIYHIFEALTFVSGASYIPIFNHGYLAVDFFFILSGFVIGYAYDDRWNKGFTVGQFVKRRLIRLHPLILLGSVVGALSFVVQGSVDWNGVHIPFSAVLCGLSCTMLLFPTWPGGFAEVRGNGEMYPLNGALWSLFFEYIGNLLYCLFVRRLSTRVLFSLVVILGLLLGWFALADVSGWGMLGVGWTLDWLNFFGGLLRMAFPYTLGMLLARCRRQYTLPVSAFWLGTLVLLFLLAVPFIPGTSPFCWNGLYELFLITIIFPLLVWVGAHARPARPFTLQLSAWLGNLSYPLYATHFPIIYLFIAWLKQRGTTALSQVWPQALGVVLFCVVLAWLSLRLYDIPLRRWLTRRFIVR